MGRIKFSESECGVESQVGARDAVAVTLALAIEKWRSLSDALGEIANREGSEVRTDFPAGWTIFWKIRDGDSRFYVAHPEADQWVATLSLSETHLVKIRAHLESGAEGPLSGLAALNRMSNLEVTTKVRG